MGLNEYPDTPMQRVLNAVEVEFEDDRVLLVLATNRAINITGDRPSDAARSVAREYKQNPARFRTMFAAERAK